MLMMSLVLSCAGALGAETPATPFVESPVDKLVDQFDADKEAFRLRRRRATPEEREEFAGERPHESDYVTRFLAIEKEHRGTDDGCRALMWIITEALDQTALELLLPAYLESERLEELCFPLDMFATKPAFDALETMSNGSPHRAVRGAATYVLAKLVKQAVDRDLDTAQPERVEGLYRRVLADYADLDHPEGVTLGKAAERDLFEYLHLSVGRIAPEIEGKDLEEAGIRLSDYRGKVVMLTFWGHWCPPCRDMFEHEKHLVSDHVNRPFALIGVNSDANLESSVEQSDRAGINWRSFWNGPRGNRGPISMRWNVRGWPSIYLIDHEGRIQNKWRGSPGDEILDQHIEKLLVRAEKAE